MVNPLLSKQQNTSREQPVAIEPTPEDYEYDSPNIPYRGAVNHGVESDNPPEPPQPYDPALDHEHYAAEPKSPDPIPVRIVQSGAREIKAWRVIRNYVGAGASLVTDQVDEQTSIRIKNTDANHVVYIGDSRDNCSPMFGWPLAPGAEIQIVTERAVYGSSDDGTQVAVAAIREFVIEDR